MNPHSIAIEKYLSINDPDRYLYKNTTAFGYTSNKVYKQGNRTILENARAFHAGLFGNGGEDLCGYTMTEVTPEMVGQKIPVFTTVEMKVRKDRLRPEQKQWINIHKNCGCNTLVLWYDEDRKEFKEMSV